MLQYKDGADGIYAYDENNTQVGEIEFRQLDDQTLTITHTGVSRELGGRGIGKHLVALAVERAKNENKLILPLCSFAAAEFRKNPEYQKYQRSNE